MNGPDAVGKMTGVAVGFSTVSAFLGLCCIGPWAVSVFGVSAAITMARFDFLRPWLLLLAALALAWAAWRVYGPRPVCPRERYSTWLKGSLWFAAALTVVAFFADQLQWWLIDAAPEALR